MARIYAALIRKGKKTIEDVPENLREEVLRILDGVIPEHDDDYAEAGRILMGVEE